MGNSPARSAISEASLVAACSGDEEAFAQVIAALDRDIWSFCRARVQEREVEDVVQEVRIAIWRALPEYKGTSKFKTWVFGIAYHKVLDAVRRVSKREALALDEAGLALEAAFIAPPKTEDQTTLWALVEKLPRQHAELIELHYRFGFTLSEIATMLDRNLNTVKYTMCQAHARLGTAARGQGWFE